MKKCLFLLILVCSFFIGKGQDLKKGDRIFVDFINVNKSSVDPSDAIDMMKDAIKNKTSLTIVNIKDSSDYYINLQIEKKMMANRSGKMSLYNTKTNSMIIDTKWKKGTSNAFSGFSGTRHVINQLVDGFILKQNPNLKW